MNYLIEFIVTASMVAALTVLSFVFIWAACPPLVWLWWPFAFPAAFALVNYLDEYKGA